MNFIFFKVAQSGSKQIKKAKWTNCTLKIGNITFQEEKIEFELKIEKKQNFFFKFIFQIKKIGEKCRRILRNSRII